MSQNSQVKGQPRGILDVDLDVVVEVQQVETRHRRCRDVRLEFLGLEGAGALAALEGLDKAFQNPFRLADHAEIGMGIMPGAGSHVRSADDRRFASRAADLEDL